MEAERSMGAWKEGSGGKTRKARTNLKRKITNVRKGVCAFCLACPTSN